ncbi:MAG: gamma-glutamyl-gamma-aminobutyrate hydrolase family protein [Candidatus Poribacteria bacterium]|nr:gamma-glutamyl-gamma-aminobutyrate hydrolase family protein [Candidatus Poribacteria bacterium]
MKPIIGITFGYNENDPTNNYIRAIEKHGGIARPLYPGAPPEAFKGLKGLLLTGGRDIDPIHYGEEEHETTDIDFDRDELELPLCKQAIEGNLPVFGICRGIQIMNVAIGSSLYQDIPSQFTDHLTHKIIENTDDSWHDIQIQPDSLLNQITSETTTEVNSRHHQSLKVIGEGFTVTAQSKDGIIEAIEDTSKKFMLGVQYHPERMFKRQGSLELQEHSARLFTAFINACS